MLEKQSKREIWEWAARFNYFKRMHYTEGIVNHFSLKLIRFFVLIIWLHLHVKSSLKTFQFKGEKRINDDYIPSLHQSTDLYRFKTRYWWEYLFPSVESAMRVRHMSLHGNEIRSISNTIHTCREQYSFFTPVNRPLPVENPLLMGIPLPFSRKCDEGATHQYTRKWDQIDISLFRNTLSLVPRACHTSPLVVPRRTQVSYNFVHQTYS